MKFIMFPLLALLIVIYTVYAMTAGVAGLDQGIATFTLMSGAVFVLTPASVFIVLGLFLLFIEILKSTKIDSSSMVNNGLSMLIFVVALILFIVSENFGTSTFFIITMMTLVDGVAGFTITAVTARRDIGFG